MKPNNQLALIVAYYLSRFDTKAYQDLGYSTFVQAANNIGEILQVNPNTIKNMRDEFDPYHNNKRIGWQRELRGSRQKVLNAFQNIDDLTMLEIVKEILSKNDFNKTAYYNDIKEIIEDKNQEMDKKNNIYIVRGPTGKAAEVYFLEYYQQNKKPVSGELIDCRDMGTGFDFEIKNNDGSFYIEIKGLSKLTGGILFTNKEWQTAKKYKKRYYLILIKNLSESPELKMIQDPASRLNPNKNIYKTLQINWSVKEKELDF